MRLPSDSVFFGSVVHGEHYVKQVGCARMLGCCTILQSTVNLCQDAEGPSGLPAARSVERASPVSVGLESASRRSGGSIAVVQPTAEAVPNIVSDVHQGCASLPQSAEPSS